MSKGDVGGCELGWQAHPVHVFYLVTNCYYFPAFALGAESFSAPLRYLSVWGFMWGLQDHLFEYYGYLFGKEFVFGKHPVLPDSVSKPLDLAAGVTSLVGISMPMIEFLEKHSAFSFTTKALCWGMFLSMASFALLSTGRASLYPGSLRWHFEHVVVHWVLSFSSLSFGTLSNEAGINSEQLMAEQFGLCMAAFGLLLMICARDGLPRKTSEKKKTK